MILSALQRACEQLLCFYLLPLFLFRLCNELRTLLQIHGVDPVERVLLILRGILIVVPLLAGILLSALYHTFRVGWNLGKEIAE